MSGSIDDHSKSLAEEIMKVMRFSNGEHIGKELDDGEFVLYVDYAKLEKENKRLKSFPCCEDIRRVCRGCKAIKKDKQGDQENQKNPN